MTLQLGTLQETVVIRLSPGGLMATASPERLAASAPAADPCTPTASSDCIVAPTKLVNMRPAYPTGHAQGGESGRVAVEARIGTNGRLANLRPETGADQAFADSVLGALRQWQYSPARLNGVPVTCEIAVIVTFQAGRDSGA
jgi:TonB family protein